jgi:hypothetical protein
LNFSGGTITNEGGGVAKITSPVDFADGSNSVRSIYFTSNKNKSPYGVLIGGLTNNVINSTGNYNSIVGGEGCTITAGEDNGIFVAKNSTIDGSSSYSVIIGGRNHTINNQFGFIGGGAQNTAGYLSAAIAGFNLNASNQSVIIGGENNTSSAAYGGIWGGVSNNVNGAGATIISAYGSLINNASYGMIGGGLSNKLYGGNDSGYSIIGGSANVVAANGAYGLFAYGGSANRIQNFAGAANATRYNYGGILGGYNNYIGSSRANSDGTTAGQNAYPLIIGGDVNTIIASSDPSTTGINWYSAILNSSNSQISGGTTGGTIINSVSSTISGRTRATMIGTSGRTATTDNATFVENLVVFNYANLNFADDTAAAAGGVVLGQIYHNAGALRVRIV